MRKSLAAAIAAVLCVIAQTAAAQTITEDATWSGEVRVSGVLVVEKGATLTIMPGTAVSFEPAEHDDEGLATSGMLVNGNIIARGGPDARISFTSAAIDPGPGDWGEIKIMQSEGSKFSGCDFSYGGWGIHVHDSVLEVMDCNFTNNSFGGLRGKGGNVIIVNSIFHGMDIGIRYWQGSPKIYGCTITDNGTGIFFRKDCEGSVVQGNNIYGNREYDLKLGDAQEKDVDVSGNWWGSADESAIRNKIFDKSREDYIGRAIIVPVLGREAEVIGIAPGM